MATENKTEKNKFSRRKFLQRGAIVMGGTVVASYLGCSPLRRFAAQKVEGMDLPATISSFKPDFWFQVLADNSILMKSPKVEMGQGIFTGYAMMAAEELEVPLEQIKVEHASTGSGIIDVNGATGGSNSTLALFTPIREVAATMREMLKIAAAKKWGVKVETVSVKNGLLTSGTHSNTYAEISAETKDWEIPKTPILKDKSTFKYIGKTVKRVDLKAKVMATTKYTIDTELPEMLHAVTLESPYFEGKIKTIDLSKAEKSNDVVKVVRKDELVAVVAKTHYAALKAIEKIEVTWDVPKKWQQADMEAIVTVGKTKATNIQKEGKAASIIEDNQAEVFKQEYRTSIATHAPMEVFGSIAYVEKDKTTIIIGTQSPESIQKQVAKTLNINSDKVDVQVAFLGGGFGRKGSGRNASNAAILSQIVGKPVKLLPTREQEFQNSVYRPNSHHVLQAKIDKNGKIEAIIHDQATPDMILKMIAGDMAIKVMGADWVSAGHGASILYNVPNKTVNIWNTEVPYHASIWRGVGMFANTFAIESFMDELAVKTKKDPIAMRIELLKNGDELEKRMALALTTIQEKSSWNSVKPANIGRGIAICSDRKTVAVAVVEVEIVEGKIQVKSVVQALDVGFAVNPEGIRSQIEGATMMGISGALFEEVLVKDGQMAVTNYHEYPMATLADTPDIQSIILENSEEMYGVGEPPIAPIAPAIANAIFNLTGKRLRQLPLQKALDNYKELKV